MFNMGEAMTAHVKLGLAYLFGVTTMIFGTFLGLELARMVAGLFFAVRWNVSRRGLELMLGDGAVMILALLALAYLPHASEERTTPCP
jgi:hypothetical protein